METYGPTQSTRETWSTISAVLTGNTYGLARPRRRAQRPCGRFRIPLIEDAAHALETDVDGRPVGSFGAVSAFSLSKHFPGRGGVLALDRERSAARTSSDCAIGSCCRWPRPRERSAPRGRRPGRDWRRLHLTRGLDRARRLARPVQTCPVAGAAARAPAGAACSSGDLGQFGAWMETGYPDYRMPTAIGLSEADPGRACATSAGTARRAVAGRWLGFARSMRLPRRPVRATRCPCCAYRS